MLCLVARIQARRGTLAESERLLEPAVRLADSPASLYFVLEERTALAVLRDDDARREELCRELVELCRSIGDRKGEALALERLAIAMLAHDRYVDASDLLERAGTICEEIDDRHREASIGANRAHLNMVLGAFAEAAAGVQQTLATYEQRRDYFNALGCVNNLSAIACLMGDADRGRRLALDALERASRQGSVLYEALAFENLAEAERVGGDLPAAIAAMETSLERRRAIGSLLSVGFASAHLAVWHFLNGSSEIARSLIDGVLRSEETVRIGNPWPQDCYWSAAQVYRALGEPGHARELVARAYAMTRERADKCPDARLRATFLGLQWHRDIFAAHNEDRWPEPPR
ncbi:MAG: hypothetical protein ABI346_03085 [Candidatus Baltobacteraceae bacterium]